MSASPANYGVASRKNGSLLHPAFAYASEVGKGNTFARSRMVHVVSASAGPTFPSSAGAGGLFSERGKDLGIVLLLCESGGG